MMEDKRKSHLFFKMICGISILFLPFIILLLICVLVLFGFFGTTLTKEMGNNNIEYADSYLAISNKYLVNGYVPLQRILYFSLENNDLSMETLYLLNQNSELKNTKTILDVCEDQRVKSLNACDESTIKMNEEFLTVSTKYFNFPLTSSYVITSFFNEQRIIYDKLNTHDGWDFAVPAQTPVYSVCAGVVEKVNFTQSQNIPYEKSQNSTGNIIQIKCDEDYMESYYVTFAHLYPNSAKVHVGDRVEHWTEIASVGTTGYSTGNHLHYQVQDKNGTLLDGMQFIDLTLSKIQNNTYVPPSFK